MAYPFFDGKSLNAKCVISTVEGPSSTKNEVPQPQRPKLCYVPIV
jgi:hypothetical protein